MQIKNSGSVKLLWTTQRLEGPKQPQEMTTQSFSQILNWHQALNCLNMKKEYTSPLTAAVGEDGVKMVSIVDTV